MNRLNLCDPGDIRELMSRHGFRLSKSKGQNFLIQSWVPERIAEEAELDETFGVLEIGPGIGCLTEQLSERAGRVVAIELDRSLKPVLQETLGERENVEVVFGDAAKMDLGAIAREHLGSLHPVAVANLPYNVTTPMLTALIDSGCFESVTVMVQREVAQRICSEAGASDYGAFTVYCNWHCETEILFEVTPDCFMPRPKVHSAVIRLRRRESPPVAIRDERMLRRVVRAAFAQRRKTLPNALSAAFPELTKLQLTDVLTCIGIDPRARGEVLDIPEFAALSDKIFDLITK